MITFKIILFFKLFSLLVYFFLLFLRIFFFWYQFTSYWVLCYCTLEFPLFSLSFLLLAFLLVFPLFSPCFFLLFFSISWGSGLIRLGEERMFGKLLLVNKYWCLPSFEYRHFSFYFYFSFIFLKFLYLLGTLFSSPYFRY